MTDFQQHEADTAELARQLRQARLDLRLTLRQVAEDTGISNGYLSLVERGAIPSPSPKYLKALADRFSLAYEELMALAGHPSGASDSSWAARASRTSLRSEPGEVRDEHPGKHNREEGAESSYALTGPKSSRVQASRDHEDESVQQRSSEIAGARINGAHSGGSLTRIRPQMSEEALTMADREELARVILEDLDGLSAHDIAQVRGYIAGLRTAKQATDRSARHR